MPQKFSALMAEATDLVQQGRLAQATSVIQQALFAEPAGAPVVDHPTNAVDDPATIIDGCVFEVADAAPPASASPATAPPTTAPPRPPATDEVTRRLDEGEAVRRRFVDGFHGDASPHGRYKLYVPTHAPGHQLPLVVMLHGCTQDPDDFAAGTRMNERAEARGFFVLYPAQTTAANASRCWNWFRREDQHRGAGEPALIAGMTAAIVAAHGIDPARVYIAGLSAGGAMAAIVAAEYPELFAAVGVHSGLPGGAAVNLPDALAAMQSGSSRRKPGATTGTGGFVPTIVFHGDRDTTVHPNNGQRVVDAALQAAGSAGTAVRSETAGAPATGKRYTRVVYRTASGESLAEQWTVHAAAHAWSGGSAAGSYTDADGPSATDEMLRFFTEHPRRGPA